MKIRNGFVSNSSSSSFLIRGVMVKNETIASGLGTGLEKLCNGDDKQIDWSSIEFVFKKRGIGLNARSNRYYFGGEPTGELILGLELASLEDGVVREITDNELTESDSKIKKELAKLNIESPVLSTFVQYISNDNY